MFFFFFNKKKIKVLKLKIKKLTKNNDKKVPLSKIVLICSKPLEQQQQNCPKRSSIFI